MGSGWLVFDAVAVLGETSEILQAGSGDAQGRFDDRHSGIVYAPGSLWQQGTSSAYYNNTWSWATNAGTLAQFTIEGNALTLYQHAGSNISRDTRFCVVVRESVEEDRLHCANYSMSRSGSVPQAPITLYGFGSGVHELYLENRDHGRGILLDAVEVR
jgi:hypothetical protein